MEAEVIVPDMARQKQIVGAVKTAFEIQKTMVQLGGEYDEMRQLTGDEFYGVAQKYASTKRNGGAGTCFTNNWSQ